MTGLAAARNCKLVLAHPGMQRNAPQVHFKSCKSAANDASWKQTRSAFVSFLSPYDRIEALLWFDWYYWSTVTFFHKFLDIFKLATWSFFFAWRENAACGLTFFSCFTLQTVLLRSETVCPRLQERKALHANRCRLLGSLVMHSWHGRGEIHFQVSDERQQSHWGNRWHRSHTHRFPFMFFFPIWNLPSFLFLGQVHPGFKLYVVWFCSFFDCCRSFLYLFYLIWKSCTLDLESRGPGPSSERLASFASVLFFVCVCFITSTCFFNECENVSSSGPYSPSWIRKFVLSFFFVLSFVISSSSSSPFCWKLASAGGGGPGRPRSFTSPFEHGNPSGSCTNCRSPIYTLLSVKKPCT